MKMNIESFKRHTASRKPKPIPLRAKPKKFQFPDLYADAEDKASVVRLEPSRVTHIDLRSATQTLIVDLVNPQQFNAWFKSKYGLDRERADIRLSRFQRAFGGMMNPHIRMWSAKDGGELAQVKTPVYPGDTVECAFMARVSKGRVYFDLHRDIIIRAQKKRKKYVYFSDEGLDK